MANLSLDYVNRQDESEGICKENSKKKDNSDDSIWIFVHVLSLMKSEKTMEQTKIEKKEEKQRKISTPN